MLYIVGIDGHCISWQGNTGPVLPGVSKTNCDMRITGHSDEAIKRLYRNTTTGFNITTVFRQDYEAIGPTH